jgi:hypothetical protein
MCRSPDGKAEEVTCASGMQRDASPEGRQSNEDFSFGTTQPIQLPHIPVDGLPVPPEATSEAQAPVTRAVEDSVATPVFSDAPVLWKRRAEEDAIVHPEPEPCNDNQVRHAGSDDMVLQSDDEFTFGTTMPLALPDLSQHPKDQQLGVSCAATESTGCTYSSREMERPNTECASLELLAVRSISPRSWGGAGQDMDCGSISVQSVMVCHQPEACIVQPMTAVYMQPVAFSAVAAGYWSQPAPMGTLPVALPCEMPPSQPDQDEYLQCVGSSNAQAKFGADLSMDQEKVDLETGECCALQELTSGAWSLRSSARWGSSRTRRYAAVFCIGVSVLCAALLVVVLGVA